MGMDVYGVTPKSSKGEYFRNNVWYWRPLWDYVESCGLLTPEEAEYGHSNDGFLIDASKAELIADVLDSRLRSGEVAEYAAKYKAELDALPLEECELCGGTGKRTDAIAEANPHLKERCNGCEGGGKKKNFATHYPFEVENVQEFAAFCRESGGFTIS
jgi:hypothetical protein